MKINWRWWFGCKPEIAGQPPRGDLSISVIIPAYNEEASIERTLASVRAQTVKIDEIIVVDDCSTDRTAEIARQAGAVVRRTPQNMGTKARAQNYVLPLIKTDLFVTIDADTSLDPRAIERTMPYFNDPRTGSVCGLVIPQRIRTLWERGRFVEYLFGITVMKGAQNNVNAVLVSSGCFSVFRTEVVRELGGFRSRSMAEDMDLTWEMHFNSYRVYFAPDAYCYPLDPPTARVFYRQVLRWYSSFFQNVAIHRGQLLKNRIGFFVYGYLLDAIFTPVLAVIALSGLAGNLLLAVALALILDLVIVSVPTLAKAGRMGIGTFLKALASLPSYPVVRMANIFIFWRALFNEWIFGRTLSTWQKGH
jgi:biofilm PGA synthesis N-glycosyltransferase PgaC